MTVREFIQGVLLIFCMLATGIILPIGLVASNAVQDGGSIATASGPLFVFEETP
jgi:hypothetical protein